MSETLIFAATYNEISIIKKFVNEINKYCNDVDILIIDDNSPDGTGKFLNDYKNECKNLEVIIRDGKLGLDTAHKKAFNYSKENQYSYLITMDADLSHDPKEIPKFIDLIKNNPFVIGSRYMTGGKCEMSFQRLMLSILGNKFIKFTLNLKSTEFTSSFRAFNLKKLNNFDMNLVNSKGYSFFMETIYNISKSNNIKETPIHFADRKTGKSKIPKVEIFRTFYNVIRLFLKNKLSS